jgi:hypothetical protein
MSSAKILPYTDLPEWDKGDRIEFYLLESVLPINTPANLRAKSLYEGFINSYSLGYASFGVWNRNTNEKLSIQYHTTSFFGGIAPAYVQGQGLQWDNAGIVTINYPLDGALYSTASLIASTTGAAYSYMAENIQALLVLEYKSYQPVTILNNAPETTKLPTLVLPKDSYAFFYSLVELSTQNGVDFESFEGIYASRFSYFSNSSELISIQLNSPQVIRWFERFAPCYNSTFTAAPSLDSFLLNLPVCYTGPNTNGLAYVYKSESEVWEVPLYIDPLHDPNKALGTTPPNPTPMLIRTELELPNGPSSYGQEFDWVDWLLIAGMTFFLGFCVYKVVKVVTAPSRRKKMNQAFTDKVSFFCVVIVLPATLSCTLLA